MATLDVQNKHIGTERRLSNVSFIYIIILVLQKV